MVLTGQQRRYLGMAVIWMAVLASSIAVIYTSHLCRQIYSKLSLLEREKNSLQVEWGRYLLEQNSWASYSRIEQLATSKLDMHIPASSEIVMVKQ